MPGISFGAVLAGRKKRGGREKLGREVERVKPSAVDEGIKEITHLFDSATGDLLAMTFEVRADTERERDGKTERIAFTHYPSQKQREVTGRPAKSSLKFEFCSHKL